MSPFHFHRQFKKATGATPAQFVKQMRMKRVKTLLATSDIPLIDVASEVGDSDQSHFTNAFRRATLGYTQGVSEHEKPTDLLRMIFHKEH